MSCGSEIYCLEVCKMLQPLHLWVESEDRGSWEMQVVLENELLQWSLLPLWTVCNSAMLFFSHRTRPVLKKQYTLQCNASMVHNKFVGLDLVFVLFPNKAQELIHWLFSCHFHWALGTSRSPPSNNNTDQMSLHCFHLFFYTFFCPLAVNATLQAFSSETSFFLLNTDNHH